MRDGKWPPSDSYVCICEDGRKKAREALKDATLSADSRGSFSIPASGVLLRARSCISDTGASANALVTDQPHLQPAEFALMRARQSLQIRIRDEARRQTCYVQSEEQDGK